MTVRWGRCFNFKKCDDADARRPVPVPEGSAFVCPQCGEPLAAEDATIPSRTPVATMGNHEAAPVRTIGIPASVPRPRISEVPVMRAAVPDAPVMHTRKRSVRVLAVAAVFLLAVACTIFMMWGKVNGASASGAMTADNTILRMAGSNTIGDSMVPALVEDFLKSQGATNVEILPGAKADEKLVKGVLPGDRSPSFITIAAHGSATAFTGLAAKTCDIGMASRKIKPDEVAKLADLGDMTSPASEHIVGLDGIALIVNSSNPLNELQKEDIKRIFTGEVTDWSQLGSRKGAINVYARTESSGTYDTFKSLVLSGMPLVQSAHRIEDSNALSAAVSSDANGIGFIGLPFIHDAKSVVVSEKGTQGLRPNRLTVATEDYSLSRRLYLYTPAAPRNKFTRLFVEFALSKQGQELVAANGFVAQNVTQDAQAPTEQAPEEYKALTKDAERLSLDFRFRAGESVLDNKAQADLDRIVNLIADEGNAADKILLFGFADNTGSSDRNKALSLNRAKLIENELIQRGLQPAAVRGFGSELAVASNDTDEGREKNRRVEIWVKE